MNHPRFSIDELIHSPVHLSIVAALRECDQVHLALLRDTVDVSDSPLSKHIPAQKELGNVKVIKGFAGKRPHTWYSLTARG